jgi:hypothetical protein
MGKIIQAMAVFFPGSHIFLGKMKNGGAAVKQLRRGWT